ncbi:nuclear transport factor 2 family protein [Herbaspirillum robiniae]|nr:nuclear transport factor 2 family protein [Herbaspirillum robiniae]
MEKHAMTRREALVAMGTGIAAAGMAGNANAAGAAAGAGAGNAAALEGAVEALRRALEEGDGKVLSAVLHDHLTYSHSDGRVWSKDVLMGNVAGKKRYLSIVTSEQTVDVQGDVGIVRHTYDVVNNDDKKSTSHIKVLLCWTLADRSWKLLARSGTNAPA